MGSSKKFWIALEAGAIALFLVGIGLGWYLFPEGGLKAWSIFIGLVVLHVAETPVGLRVGREKNLPIRRTLIKTWAFGFTWWLPVKKGILEK